MMTLETSGPRLQDILGEPSSRQLYVFCFGFFFLSLSSPLALTELGMLSIACYRMLEFVDFPNLPDHHVLRWFSWTGTHADRSSRGYK